MGLKTTRKDSKLPLGRYILKHRYMYMMILLPLVWLAIFRYWPLYGLTMSFQKFSFRKGYFGSPWVGLEHFKYLFSKSGFMKAFWNTWIINGLRIVMGFPAPVILAYGLSRASRSAARARWYAAGSRSNSVIEGAIFTINSFTTPGSRSARAFSSA